MLLLPLTIFASVLQGSVASSSLRRPLRTGAISLRSLFRRQEGHADQQSIEPTEVELLQNDTRGTFVKANIHAEDIENPPPSLKIVNKKLVEDTDNYPGVHISNLPRPNPCEDGTNGGCVQMCTTHMASYFCQCVPGYKLASDDVSCNDIDECTELPDMPNGRCDDKCHNEVGSYKCTCPTGFALVNGTACVNIDECMTNNGGCQQKCVDTEGSHLCECFQGYSTSNVTQCVDHNECLIDNGGCSDTCVNTEGGFRCECNVGFAFDPNDPHQRKCIDIDECTVDTPRSAVLSGSPSGAPSGAPSAAPVTTAWPTVGGGCNQTCINTPGSYECGCFSGYKLLEDKKSCQDINECLNNNGGCKSTGRNELAYGAACHNLPGSYYCECKHPLILVNNVTCDVDECATQNGGCSHTCKNIPGGFECECPDGFKLDEEIGKFCTDIDECAEKPELIHCNGEGSKCMNTIGSFKCGCLESYVLNDDKTTCTFVAETTQPPGLDLDADKGAAPPLGTDSSGSSAGAPSAAPPFAPATANLLSVHQQRVAPYR